MRKNMRLLVVCLANRKLWMKVVFFPRGSACSGQGHSARCRTSFPFTVPCLPVRTWKLYTKIPIWLATQRVINSKSICWLKIYCWILKIIWTKGKIGQMATNSLGRSSGTNQACGFVQYQKYRKNMQLFPMLYYLVYSKVPIVLPDRVYLVHIAPKGERLIFTGVGSESCYAHTEWHLIFPGNDVDMSLEYPYAQHFLFQTCSSLIMAIQKLPKLCAYGGFKFGLRDGWNLHGDGETGSKK